MTPEELANHLAGRAHMCSISTSETHTLAAEAYMSAAKLIRHHLCTPEFAPEFHFSNCEIRPRKGASMDVTSGGVSLDRYAIVALELLPPGFWEHVDGAPLANPLHDAAPDMLAALELISAGCVPIVGKLSASDMQHIAQIAINIAKGLPNV